MKTWKKLCETADIISFAEERKQLTERFFH